MRSSATLAAALLPVLATPALAASTLDLVDATALLSVRAYAGTGIADANLPCAPLPTPDEVEECSISGSLGEADVTRSVGPGRTGIAGSGTAWAEDGLWAASMSLNWDTWQAYAFTRQGDDLVLAGGGGHRSTLASEVFGPGAEQPGTRDVFVQNVQTLVFRLHQTTSFTFSSSEFGEYMPVQLSRMDASGEFVGEGNIPSSFSGTLAAGTYRLRNFHLLQSDFQGDWAYGWDYTMTLHDTVSAVPEPGPAALLAIGLATLGLWRRRALRD